MKYYSTYLTTIKIKAVLVLNDKHKLITNLKEHDWILATVLFVHSYSVMILILSIFQSPFSFINVILGLE